MRHRNRVKKLGRTAAHRKATLAALSNALIEHKRIQTTLVKAKALRTFVEPLIHRAKEDTTHNRRQVFRRLQDKVSVTTLFGEIAERVNGRSGGYTRVVKLGQRQGDATEVAIIELVDWNDIKPDGAGSTDKKRATRRGKRRRKKKAPAEVATAPAETVEDAEEVIEDAVVETVEVAEEVIEDAVVETVEVIEEVPVEVIEEVPAEVVEAMEAASEEDAEVTTVSDEATEAPAPDDLTRIWGIGPKFAGMLNENGIHSFAQLAEMDLDALRGFIKASDISHGVANEENWAQQAKLANAGNWEAFDAYVEQLKEK